MRDASCFVLFFGIGSLVFFSVISIILLFTDDWGLGLTCGIPSIGGLIYIIWLLFRLNRQNGFNIFTAVENHRKRWDKEIKNGL